MHKTWHACKIELVLITRNIWSWVIVAAAVFYMTATFYIVTADHDPGGALHFTSYVVQIAILASLLFGFTMNKQERQYDCDEVFSTLPSGFWSKIFGKLAALVIYTTLFVVLSLLYLYIFYMIYDVPSAFYIAAVPYMTLYWLLPFWIAGIIGMSIGLVTTSRFAYVLLVIISLLIGPVVALLETGTPLENFINLGQTDPQSPLHQLYGFSLEIQRWLQRVIWLCVVFLILMLIVTQRHYHTLWNKVNAVVLASVLVIGGTSVYLFVQEDQVLRYGVESDSQRIYDQNYYTDHPDVSFQEVTRPVVEAYEMDIHVFRNVRAEVTMTLHPQSDTDELVFTLYHQLTVDEVETSTGQLLDFEQEGDQFVVRFPSEIRVDDTIDLTVRYEGISSPYFYANERAAMLPGFFPWYPREGAHQAMIMGDDFQVVPLVHDQPVRIDLHYRGPSPIYTNLEQVADEHWSGVSEHGVTIMNGMLEEERVGEHTIVYPAAMYHTEIDELYEAIDDIAQMEARIASDLRVAYNDAYHTTMFLPIYNVMPFSGVWQMDCYRIVRAPVHASLTLPSSIESVILNPQTVQHGTEMRRFFVDAYHTWYDARYEGLDITEDAVIFEVMHYYDMVSDHLSIDRDEVESHQILAETLADWLKGDHDDEQVVNAFFQEWLDLLNGKERIKWADVTHLLDEHMAGERISMRHMSPSESDNVNFQEVAL